MKVSTQIVIPMITAVAVLSGCQTMKTPPAEGSFASDQMFLKNYTDVVILKEGDSAIAVVPEYQGRVMTSSFDYKKGPSLGWINRPVIEKGFLSAGIIIRLISPG
ncbi:hypothetical protein P4E94_13055 [Pontiellaceae bacterium B12219]|nr:hypothetical protein [Pontiellaceae bacterium B12219]